MMKGVQLMIILDQTDKRPIYEQITDKLSDLMLRGIICENEPLPSVRSLAAELSINPNTVQRAYNELEHLGYTYSVKGKGIFAASLDKIREEKRSSLMNDVVKCIHMARDAGISEDVLIFTVKSAYETDESKGGLKK